MEFEPNNLSVLAYSNGFTLWQYTTAHAATAVSGGGYFNKADKIMQPGDFVFTKAASNQARIYLVKTVAPDSVDVVVMASA